MEFFETIGSEERIRSARPPRPNFLDLISRPIKINKPAKKAG